MPLYLATLLLAILFSAHFVSAQSGWRMSRSKDSGDLVAIYFTSSEKGWVAGDNGYLAFTQDSGKSWLKYPLNTTENINEIYFRNDDDGYLAAGRKLFITDDGGVAWRETVIYRTNDFRNGTPEFLSIRFADKKRGLAIGSVLNKKGDAVMDSLVMRTNDGGETWRRVIVPSKSELFHVDFPDSSHGWIVGDKGLILATDDGGESWSVQASGTDSALYNVDFRDEDEGYAVGGKGTILRTDNGGETWERVSTGFRDTFMRVNFADDKNGWIVGHGGSILRSSDKGKTWQRQEIAFKDNLYGLYMMKKNGWAAGAGGVIIQYQK